MPLTFEKVPNSDLLKKAEYFGTSDFVRAYHSPYPDLPISQKWGRGSFFIPSRVKEIAKDIENFEVRPDDVWIVAFPKTGTTWTQEMVWQICNNLDFEKGKSIDLYERSPFFVLGTMLGIGRNTDFLAKIDEMPSQRIIKTHFPAPLLPKAIWSVKPKIIYVARNIKDTAISFYHFYRNLFGYKGTFNDYMEAFLGDAVVYTPFEGHITDFWNMRNESNIHFITFEDMKKDLSDVIRKTANFLGKSYTDEQLKKLEDHLSFVKMANNESVNFMGLLEKYSVLTNSNRDDEYKFMRKGKVGSFHEEMTPEMIEKFDSQIRKRHAKCNGDAELLNIFLANA